MAKKKNTLELGRLEILELLMALVPDILKIQELQINAEQTKFDLEVDLLRYADPKYKYFKGGDTLLGDSSTIWGSVKFHEALQKEGLFVVEGRLNPYFDDAASLTLELTVQRQAHIRIESC